jgi:hypothetical protein
MYLMYYLNDQGERVYTLKVRCWKRALSYRMDPASPVVGGGSGRIPG